MKDGSVCDFHKRIGHMQYLPTEDCTSSRGRNLPNVVITCIGDGSAIGESVAESHPNFKKRQFYLVATRKPQTCSASGLSTYQLQRLSSEELRGIYILLWMFPVISKVQSRRFTVDSGDASEHDSGATFWVRWIVGNWIIAESSKRLLSRFSQGFQTWTT